MNNAIIKFNLDNEIDIVMAHKRAVQIAEFTGFSISDQTRFATAVSEICRNCIEHAENGTICFRVKGEPSNLMLEAEVDDTGPGISNLSEILSRDKIDSRIRGTGIINSRKLVDNFNINTCKTSTSVTLGKNIPRNHPPINSLIIEGWRKHFVNQTSISPYEEIKNRNMRLLELADQLKSKNIEADLQVEEIRKLNKILESKNENLKQVAYAIAHDLKNPISTIKLSCEMAVVSGKMDGNDRFFDIVHKNLSRLVGIIDALQDTIDQDPDLEVTADLIDMDNIAGDLREQFDSYFENIGGQLLFDFKKGEMFTYPSVYLNSILSNLISNSIKYASGKPLKVKVSGRRKKNMFELKVKDNGIGIDLEKHGNKLFKIFNRFTEQGEGKGMGLNIVHYIITKNGGDIKVESTPGKGTAFYCYLKEY